MKKNNNKFLRRDRTNHTSPFMMASNSSSSINSTIMAPPVVPLRPLMRPRRRMLRSAHVVSNPLNRTLTVEQPRSRLRTAGSLEPSKKTASKCIPLAHAKKIAEEKVAIVSKAQYIAGIDFGTSSCSLAFSVPCSEKVVNLPFGNNFEEREMTAILLERVDGSRKVSVKSFGKSAQSQFNHLKPRDIEKCIYFECFKMELRRNVKLKTLIQDDKGHQHYLVEVIAIILKCFKDKFHKYLELAPFRKDERPLLCTDFEWLITVPAIWSAASKQMMKMAAQKAGLCSNKHEGIDFLSAPGNLLDTTFENTKPVMIVLEPECASIFCQNMTANMKAPFCSDDPLARGTSRYMVIDIGGGTVDISIHQFGADERIDSVIPPIGNEFGGTEINKKFAKLLSRIVGDDDFTSFKEKKVTAQGALSDIIYNIFEDEKRRFGAVGYKKSEAETVFIALPKKFLDFYAKSIINNGIAALNDKRIDFINDDTIEIEYSYFQEFIEDILKGIWECTTTAIKQAHCQIDTIYLVGGFGGSRLIYEMLKEKFTESFPGMKPRFVVPLKHDLAVSEGAVLYARNPSRIRSRVSDAHYGICLSSTFDLSKHDEYYAYENEEGEKRCGSVFHYFVSKGQVVHDNEVFRTTACPHSSQQETASFKFYSTTRDDVQYTHDKKGKLNVEFLGLMKVIIPESSRQVLPRKKREIEVEMMFSDTEIKAKGTYLPTGTEVKIELDFLSNI